jgi:Concanavalin A-like lectin/glucanases superfamily
MIAHTAALLAPIVAVTQLVMITGPAHAAVSYRCPLASATPCASPLTGVMRGDVHNRAAGYAFNLSGDRKPGYVRVGNSHRIRIDFPFTVAVGVKRVRVPPRAVGDYDVVRGTPGGSWKVEVVARKNRSSAVAMCFFNGANGKKIVAGGPDLSRRQKVWTRIACTNTGSAVQLRINGVLVKHERIRTGPIANPGPLLIGAKNTSGGDQFSGYARNVRVHTS